MNVTLTDKEKELYAKFKLQMQEDEQREKDMRDTWKRVKTGLKAEFAKFDWIEHWKCTRPDGSTARRDYEHPESRKVESAIAQLIRSTLRAKSASALASADEEKVRSIAEGILAHLLSYRDVEAGGKNVRTDNT